MLKAEIAIALLLKQFKAYNVSLKRAFRFRTWKHAKFKTKNKIQS